MMGMVPMVTTTEKRPVTMRSIVASSSSSEVFPLFIVPYAPSMPREKRSGSETMKFKY